MQKWRRGLAGVLALLMAVQFCFIRETKPAYAEGSETGGQVPQYTYEEVAEKLEYWANRYNIPPVLLKAIAWMESGWRQFDSKGNVILSADGKGIGIMQITTYDRNNREEVNRLKYDIDYNIEKGCQLLNEKWRMYPKIGSGDRNILENWYFAVWGYNGWSAINNPNNPNGRKEKAYQNMIFSLMGQKYNRTITYAPGATVIDSQLLPEINPPDLQSQWETPEPTHKGDLKISYDNLVSEGGYNGDASGDYWYGSGKRNSYYALGFYVTAYNNLGEEYRKELAEKIRLCYINLLDEADKIVANPNSDELEMKKAKKYYWRVLQGPAVDQSFTERAKSGYLKLKTDADPEYKGPAQPPDPGNGQPVPGEPQPPSRGDSPADQNKAAVKRLYGLRAEDTAIEISQAGWTRADAVIIARVDAFQDALAGAPLSKKLNAPILLTRPDKLDSAVLGEIKRLGAKKAYILGGEGAIKPEVEQSLKDYNPERIYGETAEDTAVEIAKRLGNVSRAILASSRSFPDALAASAPAAANGIPILLTQKDKLADSTLAYLKENNIREVIIVGGRAVISETLDGANGPLAFCKTLRLAGETQYDTMLRVAEYFQQDTRNIFIATGQNFPDGLAGGALAAVYGAPLLLVQKNAVTPDTLAFLNRIQTDCTIYILGGPGAISEQLDEVLKKAVEKGKDG